MEAAALVHPHPTDPTYIRRLPEKNAPYQVMKQHLLTFFTDTVAAWYRKQQGARGLPDGETGAVTAVQRANSERRLNPHFHTLFLDGTYGPDQAFRPASAPCREDIEQLVEHVGKRILRFLQRRGVAWCRRGACRP